MPNNGGDGPKHASHARPRHQITRSITELSSPIRLHRHHHQHQNGHRVREDRLPVPQSALYTLHTRSSLDNPRIDTATPSITPDPSRRASLLTPSEAAQLPQQRNMEDELRVEKERTVERSSGLKQALVELNVFSTVTTRRLDDTYYSVLEKLGALQGTVMALKELAVMSREMNEGFNADANDLVNEVKSQLDAFGNFDEQEQRIQTLQSRIHNGREKIQQLSERVDVVRQRVEGWERADREWQERTRKRLRSIWLVMAVLICLLIILFLSAQYAPGGLETATVNFANESIAKLRDMGREAADNIRRADNGTSRLDRLLDKTNASTRSNDGWVHVFDEL